MKAYSFFRYNIWGVDLADMSKLSKHNKEITHLLCAIDSLSNDTWVVPLKDKREITVANPLPK